jgi:hypothetical protein
MSYIHYVDLPPQHVVVEEVVSEEIYLEQEIATQVEHLQDRFEAVDSDLATLIGPEAYAELQPIIHRWRVELAGCQTKLGQGALSIDQQVQIEAQVSECETFVEQLEEAVHRVQQESAARQQVKARVERLQERFAAIDSHLATLIDPEAYAQLQPIVHGWQTELADYRSQLDQGTLGDDQRAQIEARVSEREVLADQLEEMSAAYKTCVEVLRDSRAPIRHELGRKQAADMLAEGRQLVTEVIRAENNRERAEYVQRLSDIARTAKDAGRRLEEQADPLSELNRDVDARLFSDRIPLPRAQAVSGEVPQPVVVQRVDDILYMPVWRGAGAGPSERRDERAGARPGPPKPSTKPSVKVGPRASGGISPPPPYHAPLDVHLSIEHDAEGYYRGFILYQEKGGDGESEEHRRERIRIALQADDVVDWNHTLRESLGTVLDKYGTGENYPPDEMRADLKELAKRGKTALRKIFDDETLALITGYFEQARDVSGHHASIQISAEDFFLPWEMLFRPPRQGEKIEEGFWGFRYNICRTVLYAGRSVTKPTLVADRVPDVSFLSEPDDSPGQMGLLEELRRDRRIVLNQLAPLEPGQAEQEMKAVEVFFRRKSHVVHIGCHAFAEDEDRDSYFKVARAFPLRLGYLMDKCTLKGEPLVLLNACNTGVNPRSTADFVRVFLGRLGACGVIATEYDVPEAFAVEFARKFYEGFLAGETVGEALLSARRYFLEKRHNPLGLLYSAYVELETCIEMQESDDGSDDGSGDGKE